MGHAIYLMPSTHWNGAWRIKSVMELRSYPFQSAVRIPSDGSSLLDESCNKMVENGVIMCVAAGNAGPAPESIVIPGDAENVITVGAVDSSGTIFELSSRGPQPKER